jgi:uncharacterized protein
MVKLKTSMGEADTVKPLFIDTGAFFAAFNAADAHHDRATAVLEAIRTNKLPYRPLYTTGYVLAELATLTLRKRGHGAAVRAIDRAADPSNVTVIHPDAAAFAAAREEFERYDDQQISFVDHVTGVLAAERDIERVFAFDDDFRTLGLTVVPEDTAEV